MKKRILIFIAFISFPAIYAQAVEEKIAVKTCDCLQKKSGVITEDIFRDCLTSTMSETILTDKTQKLGNRLTRLTELKA
jgi:hypothetical protein